MKSLIQQLTHLTNQINKEDSPYKAHIDTSVPGTTTFFITKNNLLDESLSGLFIHSLHGDIARLNALINTIETDILVSSSQGCEPLRSVA